MRKILFSILLASAAASPALAQDHGRWHKEEAQGDRAQTHEERQQQREQAREQRANGGDAARVQPQQQPQAPRFEQHQQQAGDQGQGGGDHRRFGGQPNSAPQQQAIEQQQQQVQRHYGYRGGFAGQDQQVQRNQSDGSWARDRGSWSHDRDGDFRQREVGQQQVQNGQRWSNGGSGTWNRNWRNDSRYDWRRYRNNHRSLFSFGIYYDPFGYGYRQFDIGYSFQPAYFSQQYWIDPALYGLPYPPPGTQWVRYWNDAVLVDMYSGEVVDVIHDFFW